MRLDATFWKKLALVGSAVWVGVVVLISANSRDFRWSASAYSQDVAGPAMITAVVGVAIIVIVCLAVPWIGKRAPND